MQLHPFVSGCFPNFWDSLMEASIISIIIFRFALQIFSLSSECFIRQISFCFLFKLRMCCPDKFSNIIRYFEIFFRTHDYSKRFSKEQSRLCFSKSASPFLILTISPGSERIAKVSFQLSNSSGLIRIAAGHPFLVIITFSSVRQSDSIILPRLVFASDSGSEFRQSAEP